MAEVVEGAVEVAGDRFGDQDRAAEGLGQGLDAGGLVHGAADHGEVETLGRADIAEEDLALVQRDAGAEWPPPIDSGDLGRRFAVERVDRRERLLGGGER